MTIMMTTIARNKATGDSATSNFLVTNISYKMFFFVIVTITLVCLIDPCFGTLNNCPSTETLSVPFFRFGNKEYYIDRYLKANWYRSHQFCILHGMRLASIETEDENLALVNYLHDTGHGREEFWTSGTDLGKEGCFAWFGNCKRINFTDWATEQPENSKGRRCLSLRNGIGEGFMWYNEDCKREFYFVCENLSQISNSNLVTNTEISDPVFT